MFGNSRLVGPFCGLEELGNSSEQVEKPEQENPVMHPGIEVDQVLKKSLPALRQTGGDQDKGNNEIRYGMID